MAGGRTDTVSRNGDSQKKRMNAVLPEIKRSLGAAGEVINEGLVALRGEVQDELNGVMVDCRGAKEAAAEAEINAKSAAANAAEMEKAGQALAASSESAKADASEAVSAARNAESALEEVKSVLSGFTIKVKVNGEEHEVSGAEAFTRLAEKVTAMPSTVKAVLEKLLSGTVEVAGADGETVKKTLGPQELISHILERVGRAEKEVKSARDSAASAIREAKKAGEEAEHAKDLVEEARNIVAEANGNAAELDEKSAALAALVEKAEEAVRKAQQVSSEIDGKISGLKQTLEERLDAFEKKVDETFGVVLNTFEQNSIDIVVPEEGESNE